MRSNLKPALLHAPSSRKTFPGRTEQYAAIFNKHGGRGKGTEGMMLKVQETGQFLQNSRKLRVMRKSQHMQLERIGSLVGTGAAVGETQPSLHYQAPVSWTVLSSS